MLACLDVLPVEHNGRAPGCLCSWAACLSSNSAGSEDSELEAQEGMGKGRDLQDSKEGKLGVSSDPSLFV